MSDTRVCECGHALGDHCYETSGLLKPDCDICSCKSYVEAGAAPLSEEATTHVCRCIHGYTPDQPCKICNTQDGFNAAYLGQSAAFSEEAARREPADEDLVIEIARELYDRFVCGAWVEADAYPQIRAWLACAKKRAEG